MTPQPADQARREHDGLGELEIQAGALWGIHTQRALDNFPDTRRRVPQVLIGSIAVVKHACAMTNAELGYLTGDVAAAIVKACSQICDGGPEIEKQFPLDALQGGAGTSTNMNVNEVVANLALRQLGKAPGDYATVHPLHHVNLHQSTNDVYPTALRIAAIAGGARSCRCLCQIAGRVPGKRDGVPGHPQDGPYRIAAGRADDPRPRVLGLCRSDRARPLAHLQMRGASAPGQSRRHRHRHRAHRAEEPSSSASSRFCAGSPAWACRGTKM
jgi:hypothetical protein